MIVVVFDDACHVRHAAVIELDIGIVVNLVDPAVREKVFVNKIEKQTLFPKQPAIQDMQQNSPKQRNRITHILVHRVQSGCIQKRQYALQPVPSRETGHLDSRPTCAPKQTILDTGPNSSITTFLA